MDDLANIIFAMLIAWIGSGVALILLAWLSPLSWSRPLRVGLMLVAAAVAVSATFGLFGLNLGGAAAVAAAIIVYLGYRRG